MKKLSLVLVIILIASCLGSGLMSIAFAASNTIAFDNTDVLDDLKDSQIMGEQFDPINYGYNKERQAQVLTFAEYGFNYDADKQQYYGLYVYVYNPSGQAIADERNSITVATVYEDGKAVDFDKFDLRLLSASKDEYANLFYKFKIADVSKILTRVSVNTNLRRYDVGEIELNFGDTVSEAFAVGNYYEYSGFAKGCGADNNAESSLLCKSNSIETLQLQVNSSYYLHNYGGTKQSNLSSVYFGVPQKVLDTYGNQLQQIKANWYETKTEEMVVLTDKGLYNGLNECYGLSTMDEEVDITKIATSSGKTYGSLYGGYTKPMKSPSGQVSTTGQLVYSFRYDGKYHDEPEKLWEKQNDDRFVNELYWLFYSDSSDTVITANKIFERAKEYTSIRVTDNLLCNKYAQDLFVWEVDEGRQYGWQGTDGSGVVIDAGETFDINGFEPGSKLNDWIYNLLYKNLDYDDIKDVSPIYPVKDSDIVGSAENVAKRLLIAEEDVGSFIQTYNANKLAGKQTYLFRFALTEYVARSLKGENAKYFGGGDEVVGYVSQQTVFLDFDIIWLKFVKEGVETIIPTVSSPIDIASGLNPPEINDPLDWLRNTIEWLKDNWKLLVIGIVALGIIIALIVAFIKKGFVVVVSAIAKVIWYVLKYTFMGIGYIFASPILLIMLIVRKAKARKG